MSADSRNGIETVASPRLFADSVAHFESLLAARGLTLFAKIDFAGDGVLSHNTTGFSSFLRTNRL